MQSGYTRIGGRGLTTAKAPDLAIGTRIYYTGDMANASGFGEVTDKKPADRYAPDQLQITMEDDRSFWIYSMSVSDHYNGTCATRFVTEAAYLAYREERMAAMQEEYRRMMERRAAQ